MARLVDHRRTAVDLVFDQDYAIHKEKESHLTTRRFDRNAGFISLADSIPDDLTIVGAVIVTMDDAGNYDTTYIHESLDAVPAPEVQEMQGGLVAQAFEIANLSGLTAN